MSDSSFSIGREIGSTGSMFTIVFVVLKMTGNIDWSWWWVFSPIPISLLALLVVLAVIVFLFALFGK